MNFPYGQLPEQQDEPLYRPETFLPAFVKWLLLVVAFAILGVTLIVSAGGSF